MNSASIKIKDALVFPLRLFVPIFLIQFLKKRHESKQSEADELDKTSKSPVESTWIFYPVPHDNAIAAEWPKTRQTGKGKNHRSAIAPSKYLQSCRKINSVSAGLHKRCQNRESIIRQCNSNPPNMRASSIEPIPYIFQ